MDVPLTGIYNLHVRHHRCMQWTAIYIYIYIYIYIHKIYSLTQLSNKQLLLQYILHFIFHSNMFRLVSMEPSSGWALKRYFIQLTIFAEYEISYYIFYAFLCITTVCTKSHTKFWYYLQGERSTAILVSSRPYNDIISCAEYWIPNYSRLTPWRWHQ